MRKIERKFHWEDHGTDDGIDHAVLYGPEPYMVAAVVTMDYGDPYLQESFWRVMSGEYGSLNFAEEDTSLPIGAIKKRVIIKLGNEINKRRLDLDMDMKCVMDMLMEESGKETV